MDPPKPIRPKITLKKPSISSLSAGAPTPDSASVPQSPAPQTPSGGPAKIRLVSKSQPATPADGVPPSLMGPPPPPSASAESIAASPANPLKIVTKAGRVAKPSSKKRAKAAAALENRGDGAGSGAGDEPKAKKIKVLKTPTATSRAPLVRLKHRHGGQVPQRPLGDGYDSEAEDREVDPVIEEQLIFRMMPGEHCDYIRNAIKDKTLGLSRQQHGADVSMKWIDNESRRCMITVQGQPYAAVLVDLPTITEGTKTWDKKAFVKSADICQMLLVFAKVTSEQEAKSIPLPSTIKNGYQWPHGLTPPMHDCRNRRFRKRLSKLEIQNKDAEVERLLAADKSAVASRWEMIDDRQDDAIMEESGEEYDDEDADADAYGDEVDYFSGAVHSLEDHGLDDDMVAELEAEFMNAEDTPMEDFETPAGGLEGVTPMTANTGTPAAQAESGVDADGDDESGEDDDEDEEGEDGDVDDGDDEDRHDEVAGVRVEIANMRKKLAIAQDQLSKSVQPIMRKRIEGNIKNIRSELELKKSSIGDTSED
ncbi:hypothetical protein GQ53DRAFT_754550 [Thozetella sp. PMI_491]|nr:hypothetical protein GQ53DRAFT_754550 [Thozetella sp. PMI_491]